MSLAGRPAASSTTEVFQRVVIEVRGVSNPCWVGPEADIQLISQLIVSSAEIPDDRWRSHPGRFLFRAACFAGGSSLSTRVQPHRACARLSREPSPNRLARSRGPAVLVPQRGPQTRPISHRPGGKSPPTSSQDDSCGLLAPSASYLPPPRWPRGSSVRLVAKPLRWRWIWALLHRCKPLSASLDPSHASIFRRHNAPCRARAVANRTNDLQVTSVAVLSLIASPTSQPK